MTPNNNARNQSLFMHHCLQGNIKEMNQYLNLGADIDASYVEYDHKTPLQLMATQGKADMVEELLKKGADVNKPNPENDKTALHYAAEAGNINVMQVLIKHGADLEAHSKKGSVLNFAVENNKAEAVELLIASGVDVMDQGFNDDDNLSTLVMQNRKRPEGTTIRNNIRDMLVAAGGFSTLPSVGLYAGNLVTPEQLTARKENAYKQLTEAGVPQKLINEHATNCPNISDELEIADKFIVQRHISRTLRAAREIESHKELGYDPKDLIAVPNHKSLDQIKKDRVSRAEDRLSIGALETLQRSNIGSAEAVEQTESTSAASLSELPETAWVSILSHSKSGAITAVASTNCSIHKSCKEAAGLVIDPIIERMANNPAISSLYTKRSHAGAVTESRNNTPNVPVMRGG